MSDVKTVPPAAPHSDALVFFGATGDLAYKKIFPALQAMIKRGTLDVPVIGVAKAGWNLDQLKARAKDSARAARRPRPRRLAEALLAPPLRRRRLRRPRHLHRSPQAARLAQHPGPLPRHPTLTLRKSSRAARPIRQRQRRTHDRRKALRP